VPGRGNRSDNISQRGRDFTVEEVVAIREVVGLFPRLSRNELAQTLCEHLGWFTASGSYKLDACLKLLEQLSDRGELELPEKFRHGRRGPPKALPGAAPEAPAALSVEPVCGSLKDLGAVSLDVVSKAPDKRAWNEAVEHHHYLGYKRAFGCRLKYFITSRHGRLGCLLLAGAAKSMGARDRWIGWTARQRLRNLPWVVNNTRFLLFPWVQVKHLASHVLGQLSRRLQQDWQEHFGYRPVLLETFVDPQHYSGTCYRAAGWMEIGRTTGEGLRRPGCTYTTTPKRIFMQPLTPDFRALLCSETLQGRNPDE